jgi:excisionase family DNA binding protein
MANSLFAGIEIKFNSAAIQQLAEALAPLLQSQTPLQTQPQETDLISRDEVCKILHFNKTTLNKHTKSGRLQSYAIGNRVLYKRSEVLESVRPLKR